MAASGAGPELDVPEPLALDGYFPSPFDWNSELPATLVELRMRQFSGVLREKPRWWEKVFDDSIVDKWRQEIVDQDKTLVDQFWGGDKLYEYDSDKLWPREAISERQLDYIFDELRYLAGQRDAETGIQLTAIPSVYQSSELIPQKLKQQLVSAVSVLESAPPEELDWHPGSDGQVLDLVHPSMYCYRIGHSLSRGSIEAPTKQLSVLSEQEYLDQYMGLLDGADKMLSHQHQWIPTDFDVSTTGQVRPVSYIHNVHPFRHQQLYGPITAVLERFIPLFESVLTDSLDSKLPSVIKASPGKWYNHVDGLRPTRDTEDYAAKVDEFERVLRWPQTPEAPPFTPPPAREHERVSLRGTRLQVIVKLANIILTPEKPRYAGGTWHVEGMANERIVATGIYYYASENITESRLAFRTSLGDEECGADWEYEQSDRKGYLVTYGMYNEMNQVLGSVVAREDKCLAFPNRFQHRVHPFELADPSKPGVRKILCFFLVDPTERVLGTSLVPPQQRSWYTDEVRKIPAMQKLPQELWDWIMEYALEGTITREEAEAERAELMEERSASAEELNEEIYEQSFNMCEH